MFLHLFKYRIKTMLRQKDLLGWMFAFPIILGTFFYLSFGGMMKNPDYSFSPVPIALVETQGSERVFVDLIQELSEESSNQLFKLTKTDLYKAEEMLEKGEVDGIIISGENTSVTVSKKGLNQTIIKSFMDAYLKHSNIIKEIGSTHPENMEKVIDILRKDVDFNTEVSLTNTQMDTLAQYFFALIAMTCMYGSFIGKRCVEDMQANISALGARRETSPAHKLSVILADFCGSVMVEFLSVMLLLVYLTLFLKIDFGTRVGYIILTAFAGSVIGVAMGTFFGSINRLSENMKEALVTLISLVLSFLSGLMINTMKDIIEHTVPFINRINPAALITDCLYSLIMYESLDRFYSNIAIMGVIAALFILGSYLQLRRNRYASI